MSRRDAVINAEVVVCGTVTVSVTTPFLSPGAGVVLDHTAVTLEGEPPDPAAPSLLRKAEAGDDIDVSVVRGRALRLPARDQAMPWRRGHTKGTKAGVHRNATTTLNFHCCTANRLPDS